ncbi:MAG: ATP-binding protein [Solirubrobacteraceae bacterium]
MTATCMHCGDEVGTTGCPTCGGATAPGETASAGDAAQALLSRVADALEAQARRARRPLSDDARPGEPPVVRRLRRQAVLLSDALAESEQLGQRLREALDRVEHALKAVAPVVGTIHEPLVDVALPRTESCAELARRQVSKHATEVLDAQTVADAVLIASELVNNAYLHGSGRITLRLYAVEDRLRIEVADEGEPTWIGVRAQVDGGTGGWGLWIVERLALAWGAEEMSARVWADVPLRHAPRVDPRATDARPEASWGEPQELEAER